MRALLWKDYRLNRAILILGLAMLLGPYLAAGLLGLRGHARSPAGGAEWSSLFGAAADFSLGMSLLTVALLAGNAFAGERADRSAEFLFGLPLSRRKIVSGKAILALGATAVIWGVNLLMVSVIVPAVADTLDHGPARHSPVPGLAATSLLLLGAGWLGSSLLESPSMATGVAFAGPILVIGTLLASSMLSEWPAPDDLEGWYKAGCLVLSPTCFVAGTAYYLQRVEP